MVWWEASASSAEFGDVAVCGLEEASRSRPPQLNIWKLGEEMQKRPHLVGVGGTFRPGSTTECAIRNVLQEAGRSGATTEYYSGQDIAFPVYNPASCDLPEDAKKLLESIRHSDAVILGSPAYHAGVSGLVKNAIDYLEELSADAPKYLDGRAVLCIATGGGWQGGNATLQALRSISHSLRGWTTPLGIVINSSKSVFGENGECLSEEVQRNLSIGAQQLMAFCAGFGTSER